MYQARGIGLGTLNHYAQPIALTKLLIPDVSRNLQVIVGTRRIVEAQERGNIPVRVTAQIIVLGASTCFQSEVELLKRFAFSLHEVEYCSVPIMGQRLQP
jgi:hypothetical protein